MRRAGGPAAGRGVGDEPTIAGPFPTERPAGPPARLPACCNRCGFEVQTKPWGCKNPCPNCGTVYPLGDCSD